MTTKPTWTDEEKFWRDIRRGLLELVNVVETCKLSVHLDTPTSQIRKQLKSYQRAYIFSPAAAGEVKEDAEILTIDVECDKL